MPDRVESGAARASAIRRLATAVLVLAIIDAFVPRWVARAERARYEGADVFRFQYSDLFALGPVVEYLREHPRGERPRAVFLGDSVVWGFRLQVNDSLPVQFQRLEPSVRVLNFAVNGFAIGSAYLLLKDVIDSIDAVYVHVDGAEVNPGLARLIPVGDEDIRRFNLERPDRVEQWLQARLGVWRLYRLSYRLQSALFGTSTRNYVYAHKAALFGGEVSAGPPEGYAANPPGPDDVTVDSRVEPSEPAADRLAALAAAEPWLWESATYIRAHGKRAVFWRLTGLSTGPNERWAGLNRAFRGSAIFVTIGAPREMMIDDRHLSARGSAAVARVLHEVSGANWPQAGAVH